MTIAQFLYRNHLFIAGTVLIALGLGNCIAANSKVNQYQAVRAEIAPPQVSSVPPLLLHEERRMLPSEARERWEIARAKLDFYRVVLSSGQLMMGLGLICVILALIRLRRQFLLADRQFPIASWDASSRQLSHEKVRNPHKPG
jgi:hypothetical protein